ncbi:MAG: MATE family efflux transporter [Thomasclavelia ramosa]
MEGKNGLMTHGNIAKQLIVFAIPLLVGNLFQQLYNTVDSIVVGNFIGDQALAAVNSSGPIIDMLVSFFMGLSLGAGVLISNYFGAQDCQELKKVFIQQWL